MTSKGQSGSSQTDEPTEVVVSCIPVGNDKEVMITRIVGPSLPDNEEDELGGSIVKIKQPAMAVEVRQKTTRGCP